MLLAMSGAQMREKVLPFAIPKPAPGVVPESAVLAADTALVPVVEWAGSYGAQIGMEGLAFMGYPLLSELAQRPEYRRIVETIAREMTRRWIRITAKGNDDKADRVAGIEAACERLRIKDVFRKAAEHDGFFGRAHIFPDLGVELNSAELRTPIGGGFDEASRLKIKKGDLKGIKTVEPVWCYPSGYNATDPLSPNWYRPESWYVQGRQVHASRLLTMVGREVPDMLKPAYMFGGLSMTQMAKEYVDNWLETRRGVNRLINSFSVSGIKVDMVSALSAAEGQSETGADIFRRVALFNNLRENSGTMLLHKGSGPNDPAEEFFNVSTPLSTLDVLQAQSQEHIASVSGIPLVKLLGVSPAGLNASSEGEIRVFYDEIHAYQELLFRGPLTTILGLVQLSEFGDVDPDITFTFEPLADEDDKAKAEVKKIEADTDSVYIQEGVLLPEEVRTRIATDPETAYPGLDLSVELNPPDPGELADVPEPALEDTGE